jgi:hypothetical protein
MLGALGEIAGAAVVALSLIYLGRQIHLSNRMAQAEAYRTFAEKNADLSLAFAANPVLRSGWLKVTTAAALHGDLEPEEDLAVALMYDAALQMYQQGVREVGLGILPREARDELSCAIYDLPYFKSIWPMLRGSYSRGFEEFIEARYASGAKEPATEA